MSKAEILEYFNDINVAYNNSGKHDSLKNMLDELEKEIRNKAIDDFAKEIVVEYDNDGCPNVTDYLDYRLTIRELFEIAEQMKGE